MGLKAGWLALFIFVWVIGTYLGSTYDYQNTSASSGSLYSTGTATFTQGSTGVVGIGTAWVTSMEDGVMKSNTDGVWVKILTVVNPTNITLYSLYPAAGGAGMAYTMQPTPGWVGIGTGGYSEAPTTTLGAIMEAKDAIQKNPVVGSISVITNGKLWSAVYKIITWQWIFMQNPDGSQAYGMFYWIFLFPFVAMGFLSVILLTYGIITGNLTWS
jgi:hypothetical protein